MTNTGLLKLEIIRNGQIPLIAAAALLILKIIPMSAWWIIPITDALFIVIAYFIVINLSELVRRQSAKPLTVLIGSLIAAVLITFVLGILEFGAKIFHFPDILTAGVNTFLFIILLTGFSYLFVVFRELFFLKQKKDLRTQHNALSIYFVLSGLTSFLTAVEGFKVIFYAIFWVTIFLIGLNSMKIAWIAFLSKKEKRQVLLLCIVLSIIFIINWIKVQDSSKLLLTSFSPAIQTLLLLISIYGLAYSVFLFFITVFHLPTAEVFDRRSREISSLQYVGQLINRVFDFKELAQTVTDLATNICNADAAWIVLKDNSHDKILSPKGISFDNAEHLTASFRNQIENINTVAFIDLRHIARNELLNEKYHSAAVAPLKAHESNHGYLITIKKQAVPFDEDDKSTLATFADYAAISFENSRLFAESIEKERLVKELDVAREMQKKLIPSNLPQHSNVVIAAAFIPANEVGGDYYDFFELDNNRLGFIIADVSGKGISAAFIMAEIRGIFESLGMLLDHPREVLRQANTILQRTLDRKHFITAIYGILDERSGILDICRAGHPPMVIIRNGEIRELLPQGMGLGLQYSGQFEGTLEEISFKLEEGDTIICFTDGITETKNELLEDFGLERLKRVIQNHYCSSPSELKSAIMESIRAFAQNTTQHDDITLIIFQWKTSTMEKINA